jgi:hypothetical protein
MKLIAHRGNLSGPDPENENKPSHIQKALNIGVDVEIDVWWSVTENIPYLGHDGPQYKVSLDFLRQPGLWLHCKNILALEKSKAFAVQNPYFWHQEDDVTLTSNGLFWTYPGKPLTPYSIAVMPEWCARDPPNIDSAYGICTDYVLDRSGA